MKVSKFNEYLKLNESEEVLLYRGISKQELIDSCKGGGKLIYHGNDGKIFLTTDIDKAKHHSNYVVRVLTDNDLDKVNDTEFKAYPDDCTVTFIYEFDTQGRKINNYTINEFLDELETDDFHYPLPDD